MKRFMLFMTGCLSFFMYLLTGCEHRPLIDPEYLQNRRFVRIYLDEEIRNVSFGFYNEAFPKPEYHTPEVMRVVLCDEATGHVKYEAYLKDKGTDERGNYLQGYITAAPGNYRMLTYNFDTESVHLYNEYVYDQMYAYTNKISDELYKHLSSVKKSTKEADWKIVYEPDHFFVENGGMLQVENWTDTLHVQGGRHFTATTCVKSYYLQVEVKGAQKVNSAVALLSGMAGSVKLAGRQMRVEDPVAVHFGLHNGTDKDDSKKVVAYATFNTFGKLEEQENYLNITFEF